MAILKPNGYFCGLFYNQMGISCILTQKTFTRMILIGLLNLISNLVGRLNGTFCSAITQPLPYIGCRKKLREYSV